MGKGYQVREVIARIIWSFLDAVSLHIRIRGICAIADGLYNIPFSCNTGIHEARSATKPEFQLCFDFWDEAG